MSYQDYKASQRLEAAAHEQRFKVGGNPFYSLLMAAMRAADTENLERLKTVFPQVHDELKERYHAPGGFLEDEQELMAEIEGKLR